MFTAHDFLVTLLMISLVIPIYNEEELIETLFERVIKSLQAITEDFEVVCVNDGSTDGSLAKMVECHHRDNRFKVLVLSRNFGHQAAYTAGLSYAKGDYIAMMDGDLQDPPELLKQMYWKLVLENHDVIYGRRLKRNETWLKRQLIRSFHNVFRNLSNIEQADNVGNFSIMNRKALQALLSMGEKNRYLPGIRFFIGFKQGFVDYERPDREIGQAKMSFKKLFTLAFDAIFSFSN